MNNKVVMHPFGWMAISAFSMVIGISASISLSTSDRWWRVALSKLSAEPFGFVFSLGFVISASTLAMALHLQLRHMDKHWAGQYWRLYAFRWLLLTLCAGLALIGLFPDMDPWLTPHRLGGWLCVISATLISLGVYVWLPPYPPIFKRFSVVIGVLPYVALLAYVLHIINFTTIELFLLVLGAIWMSVFYAYTRVFTGSASPDILVEGGD
jgi:hypothetical protein